MNHRIAIHHTHSRAASLALKEHRAEALFRRALFVSAGISCAVYVSLVFLTVITAIDGKEVDRKSSARTTEIARLEAEYFTLAQGIVKPRAEEFALTNVSGKHFVTKAPSLGLAPSTVR